jgi:hypothetical protein
MQQKTETQNNISRDLYKEVAGNLEVLNRVDENAALDTPEDVAALRSVIGALKVGTATTILLYTKTLGEGTIRYNLSKALNGIFLLKSIDGMDSSAIVPQTHKPLLGKIRPVKYLADIKYYTERIYTALST